MRTFKRRCSSSADMVVSSAGHASTLPDGPGSSSAAASAARRGSASGTLPGMPDASCGSGGTPGSSAGGSAGTGGASDGSGGGLEADTTCPLLSPAVDSPFNIPESVCVHKTSSKLVSKSHTGHSSMSRVYVCLGSPMERVCHSKIVNRRARRRAPRPADGVPEPAFATAQVTHSDRLACVQICTGKAARDHAKLY